MKLSVFNGSLPKIGIRPTIDGRLADAAEPPVNRGPDADLGQGTVEDRKFHVLLN